MNAYMIAQVAWAYAISVFASLWMFFKRLLNATGMQPIYVTVVLFAIAFRLLAAPLVGAGLQAGSDMYRSGAYRLRSRASSRSTGLRRQ